METGTKVSDSIIFNLGNPNELENKEWLGLLRDEIDGFENAKDFEGLNIICVENNMDGHYLQDFYGITLALDVLRTNPKAKVLLYGFTPVVFVAKRKPELGFVLKHENAFLLEAPFHKEALQNLFKTPKFDIVTEYTALNEANKHLSHLFHDLKYVSDWDNPSSRDLPEFEKIIKKAREYFPVLKEKLASEIIAFLRSVEVQRPLVMKDKKIPGVYCDTEGTLLVNGVVNQKVVAALQKYHKQGKQITVWTDGDITELGPKLQELGITNELKSKFDHAGAIAEIVIDDMDEYTFGATTKISAGTFIHVSELG